MKSRSLCHILLLLIYGGLSYNSIAQDTNSVHAEFCPAEDQTFGFDKYIHPEWMDAYETIYLSDSSVYRVSYKSMESGRAINYPVDIVFHGIENFQFIELVFKIGDSIVYLPMSGVGSDTLSINLPDLESSYALNVHYEDTLIGRLNVVELPWQKEKVIVVPLMDTVIDGDSLSSVLNSVYNQANIQLTVQVTNHYKSEEFDQLLLNNPSPNHDRFTDQMTMIRNAYFDDHPYADKRAYYVFVVPGFVNPKVEGYMVRNKAVAFVKGQKNMDVVIARQLGYGMGSLNDTWLESGPQQGSTSNLMDTLGATMLTFTQWESIQHSCHSISYYDDYESVRTNNGIIAYYFWEEDQDGNIVLSKSSILKSIQRPFKKNQFSIHLDIDNVFFIPLFSSGPFPICTLHLIAFLVLAGSSVYVRKRIFKRVFTKPKKVRLMRFTIRSTVFFVFIGIYTGCFSLINYGYSMFEVNAGQLRDLDGLTVKETVKAIRDNKNNKKRAEKGLGSQVLVKKDDNWYLKKRKRVLYFNVRKKDNKWTICRFTRDSDTLTVKTENFKEYAESHYFVFSYLGENNECLKQKVFNPLGVEVTNKLELDDPAKRILLFVNGYRPTSLGKTFEEHFYDIRRNGLEFANSINLIYSFDRYAYWRPWKEIDLLFQNRLNPSETYYADGHFSVSTSNHRSLVNFTTLSTIYPERCKNEHEHVCQRTSFGGWSLFGWWKDSKTVELYNLKPNKSGFKKRRRNGRIAGRNLAQIFNELPHKSSNDTLYIVAHSMGYAYSLGIVEQLRGKINFGGFYIIAPENASAGKVNREEWKEVWQYGSDFDANKISAPCLLDGIAPQTKAGGLTPKHRSFIPENLYQKKGFFNSHFIGYYTWLFDIPKNEIGYIPQR
ncbi:MAG: hypothetical protein JKY09_04485 [Crocinitomicaceae bacterium]|nr:hypothetical protein [Crocinitomicaceae bacterium]